MRSRSLVELSYDTVVTFALEAYDSLAVRVCSQQAGVDIVFP